MYLSLLMFEDNFGSVIDLGNHFFGVRLPRWLNGCKCDCRARTLRFDFRAKYYRTFFGFSNKISVVTWSLGL